MNCTPILEWTLHGKTDFVQKVVSEKKRVAGARNFKMQYYIPKLRFLECIDYFVKIAYAAYDTDKI